MLSAALVAVTEQVPVPLVIVTVVPLAEQAPVAAKVTVPVPLPPEEATVKVALNGCGKVGMPVTDSAVWLALLMVTDAGTLVAEL